jgi:drug/metabolite transporter (DMT)-like permease
LDKALRTSAPASLEHAPAPGRYRRRAIATDAIIVLLSLIWGTTYFVIARGLEDLPPFTSAGARFALAALVFAVVAHFLARKEGGARPTLGMSIVMGLFNFAVPYSLVYLAETRLPSGLVSVLWATFPAMLAILSHAMLPTERLRLGQWTGIAVGFAGIVVLFATDLAGIDEGALALGLLLLLSPAAAALGNLLVKKHAAGTSSLLLTRNGIAIAAPLLLLVAFLGERDAPAEWTSTAIGSVLYLAIVGTVVTFGLYFWALRHAPAHRMGMITYLTPTIALTVGSAAGGEPFHWHTLLGTVLVLGSVALVLRRPR